MTAARVSADPATTYELLNLTPDGAALLVDRAGRRVRFQELSAAERVEVRCDVCGTWSGWAVRSGDGWACPAHALLRRAAGARDAPGERVLLHA